MINALLVAVSEEQLRSNLRKDLPLVILGSIIAAIGWLQLLCICPAGNRASESYSGSGYSPAHTACDCS